MGSTVIPVRLKKNFNFFDMYSKNTETSIFMKIRQMAAEFFHADGRTETDRHDESNSGF